MTNAGAAFLYVQNGRNKSASSCVFLCRFLLKGIEQHLSSSEKIREATFTLPATQILLNEVSENKLSFRNSDRWNQYWVDWETQRFLLQNIVQKMNAGEAEQAKEGLKEKQRFLKERTCDALAVDLHKLLHLFLVWYF